MDYVWDETRREENRRKHGVDFADAVGALEDPFILTAEDPDARPEVRLVTIGRGFDQNILLVVWTERDEESIRIITARRVSPGEARHYNEQLP